MAKALNKSLAALAPVFDAYSQARQRLLLLDYDGTLAPFAPRPDQAKPSARVLSIIKKLTSERGNIVVIISGRDKNVLDNWLGHLPVQFVAEHGAFEKYGDIWQTIINLDTEWKEKIRPIMQSYVPIVPGSLLEEKETGLAYHYRDAPDQLIAQKTAEALFNKLRPLIAKFGLRATHTNLTIEIRHQATDKGQAALASLARNNYDFIMCAGDSETDEDMFKALANKAFCIKIGTGKTAAAYRTKSPETFIDFLELISKAHA